MFKTGALLRSVLVLNVTFFFTACSVHKIDKTPQDKLVIPKGYSFSSQAIKDRNISTFWHEEFLDKKLSSLIAYAYKNNYDINSTIAKIKAARALSNISDLSKYPELYLEASSSEQFRKDDTQNTSRVGATLSWEIDLFNKLQNKAMSDTLEYEALKDELEALKLSLGSEIAAAYYGAVSAKQSLRLLNKQVELNKHYLDLVKLRFDQGVATNLEVLQQKAQVEQSKSLIPPTLAELRTYENRLDVLLGKAPDSNSEVVEKTSFLDVVLPKNIGVPSELLLFRPDLRAQLKRLIAADADIAVAVADRLPSLTLSGGGYYSDSNSYSGALGLLSASLIQPLLDWGARKAEVSRNKALYEEQLAVFSSMYLEALEEVETTIYTQKQQVEYIKRLEYRKDLLDQTVKEAEFQYLQGVSDYLSVLNALVSLHTLERSLVEAKYNLVLYKINLHKALGSTVNISKENG